MMPRILKGMSSKAVVGLLTLVSIFRFSDAAIFVKIPGVDGEFCAESYSIDIVQEEEPAPSRKKGDTCQSKIERDKKNHEPTIGPSVFRSVNITKRIDQTTPLLMRSAITGEPINNAKKGHCQICYSDGVDDDCDGIADGKSDEQKCDLKIIMEHCFVMNHVFGNSDKAADRPTEEVAFYFNKIAIIHRTTNPLHELSKTGGENPFYETSFGWNNEECKEWTDFNTGDPGIPIQAHKLRTKDIRKKDIP